MNPITLRFKGVGLSFIICGWICGACCVFGVLRCMSSVSCFPYNLRCIGIPIATDEGLRASNFTDSLGGTFHYIY